jgi:hypothetical protein
VALLVNQNNTTGRRYSVFTGEITAQFAKGPLQHSVEKWNVKMQRTKRAQQGPSTCLCIEFRTKGQKHALGYFGTVVPAFMYGSARICAVQKLLSKKK